TPAWPRYAVNSASIPAACAPGGAAALVQFAPSASVLSREFSPVTSWRANVNGYYRVVTTMQLSFAGTLAFNEHLPGVVDLNLRSTPAYSIASEGTRPSFVAPANIVAATGAASWSGSRATSAFSHVLETRSDLRGRVGSFTAGYSYSPIVPNITTASY